ncbi:MAG TPA: GerMN domain-containing protein, partial [Symbiobacteriaceae bacterium]|nr:GerMN domain-containing protein [Symbiobacteriaceae bacterium]
PLSSNSKARVSSNRPPQRARVLRSGGGRKRKGRGPGRFLFGPVGAVLLGVLLVLGIGYAVKVYKPAAEPADAKVTAPGTEAPKNGTATPGTSNSTTTQPATTPVTTAPATTSPAATTPATTTAPTPVADRAHIDRSGGATNKAKVTIYYADGQLADSLQPVEIQIPFTTGWIKAIADQVVDPPRDLKLDSGLPPGTKVKSVDLRKDTGTAVVDLSPEAKGVQSASDASKIKAAFVYSLTELKDVKSVLVWINGFPAQFGPMVWDKPITRAELEAQKLFKVEPVIHFQS